MENFINVAEILKNCSKGMELNCISCNGVVRFEEIYEDAIYPIKISITYNDSVYYHTLTQYGKASLAPYDKCIIFPKGKTTWEGFVPPCKFKDGDIVVNASGNNLLIYKGPGITNRFYVVYDIKKDEIHFESIGWYFSRLATTKEQEKLFQKLKDIGYKWNEEKKCVEKLPKFKDGDIVAYDNESSPSTVFIYRNYNPDWNTCYFVGLSGYTGKFFTDSSGALCGYNPNVRFATEEEKERLFQTIKSKGYRWNTKTKTLEELVKPKFKVGDIIKSKVDDENILFKIKEVQDNDYIIVSKYVWKMPIKRQDDFELVPNKFDITTLEPFKEVLVRNCNTDEWNIDFFGYYSRGFYHTIGRGLYRQCIPYKGNEYLRGTAKDCKEYYKTWEK